MLAEAASIVGGMSGRFAAGADAGVGILTDPAVVDDRSLGTARPVEDAKVRAEGSEDGVIASLVVRSVSSVVMQPEDEGLAELPVASAVGIL